MLLTTADPLSVRLFFISHIFIKLKSRSLQSLISLSCRLMLHRGGTVIKIVEMLTWNFLQESVSNTVDQPAFSEDGSGNKVIDVNGYSTMVVNNQAWALIWEVLKATNFIPWNYICVSGRRFIDGKMGKKITFPLDLSVTFFSFFLLKEGNRSPYNSRDLINILITSLSHFI